MANKLFSLSAIAFGLTLSLSLQAASFPETWVSTQEGAYRSLPEYKTSKSDFIVAGFDRLANAAKRTIDDSSDILPHFQKLVHPIGICFAGTWNITEKSQYSGYFAKGAKGLIIARASEAMGNGVKGDWRAFGLAGKIYPTQDPKDARNYKTANFFTVDDLGGTDAESFLSLPKTNEPAISKHLSTIFSLPTILAISKAFRAADDNPAFRPVTQIAELGLDNPREANSPQWLMLQAESKAFSIHSNTGDFRNELRLKNFPNDKLKFGILVSSKGDQSWTRIGSVELTQEALASGCDHRLHFQHPRLRN